MDRKPVVTTVLTRHVTDMPLSYGRREVRSRLGVYAPLVVGPAILHGPDGASRRWRVHVSGDGRLLPLGPQLAAPLSSRLRSLRSMGATCRMGAALLSSLDVAQHAKPFRLRWGNGPATDFYGWALLYQSRSAGVGLIDPHERFAELPAFYESPQELLDRAAFLAAKGVASRALALVTEEADFVIDGSGRRHNRFFPECIFCQPHGFGWLDEPVGQS
jgi:hypothetical protein